MPKGCQRRIYHITRTDSSIFEEAYFVLNKRVSTDYGAGLCRISEGEMAEEAERILKSVCRDCGGRGSGLLGRMGKAWAFVLGAAASSAVIGGAALLLALA